MKVWLPYVEGGSGSDVFTLTLATALRSVGIHTEVTKYPHNFQYFPWPLQAISPPEGTSVIIANSWNAFAFRNRDARLIAIEHHCVFDPQFSKYKTHAQRLYHESLVKHFELKSFKHADSIVSVSDYTARSLMDSLDIPTSEVIYNGIDVQFFQARDDEQSQMPNKPFKLLFVGNASTRKGADLLAPIMNRLGNDFLLEYTGGLRSGKGYVDSANARPLGRLSTEQLRSAYARADALIFPTRLEGFGYAAVESMACGTPVIATNVSSIPELVTHERDGLLCNKDDVAGFVNAAQTLQREPETLSQYGIAATRSARQKFSIQTMAEKYREHILTLVS